MKLPLIVVEEGNAHISLLRTAEAIEFFIEEFNDILGSWSYWDADGRTVAMSEAFSQARVGGRDVAGLETAVQAYALRNDADTDVVESIMAILKGLAE